MYTYSLIFSLYTYDSVKSDIQSCLQPYKKFFIRTALYFFYMYDSVKIDMQSCLQPYIFLYVQPYIFSLYVRFCEERHAVLSTDL